MIPSSRICLPRLSLRAKHGGEARGEARGLQKSILNILNVRFPILAATSQTQQAVASIQDIEKLEMLQQALLLVSDEQVARVLLKLPAQGDLL